MQVLQILHGLLNLTKIQLILSNNISYKSYYGSFLVNRHVLEKEQFLKIENLDFEWFGDDGIQSGNLQCNNHWLFQVNISILGKYSILG